MGYEEELNDKNKNRGTINSHIMKKHSKPEGLNCCFCKANHSNRLKLLSHMMLSHMNRSQENVTK